MTFNFRLILPAIWIFLYAGPLAAANLYVRDGGAGTTCADWGANACDQVPSMANINRGDRIYIADGTYSGVTFNKLVSGTTLITIKKATIADHGTDVGWNATFGDGTSAWGAVTFNTSHWVFDGVTGGGPGSWTSGHGFTFSSAAGTSVEYISFADGVSNIAVRHCSFTQTGNTEVTTARADGLYAPGILDNSTFEYNYFDNIGGLPFFFRHGSGNIVQYNWSGNICGMSVADVNEHCEALVLHDMDDLHFRWNYIGESPSSGGFVKNNVQISDSIRIYGNVFRNGFPIQCNTGRCTNWRVFNNTFVTGITGGFFGGDGIVSGLLIYNNVTYGAVVSRLRDTHDFNWYSAITSSSCSMQSGTNENVNRLFPLDCDRITETLNPFVNSNGTTPEALRLTGPLIGHPGTNVCALDSCTGNKMYNVDAFGVTRGADGVWDRGAYERVSTGISPPSNLRIVPQEDLMGRVFGMDLKHSGHQPRALTAAFPVRPFDSRNIQLIPRRRLLHSGFLELWCKEKTAC